MSFTDCNREIERSSGSHPEEYRGQRRSIFNQGGTQGRVRHGRSGVTRRTAETGATECRGKGDMESSVICMTAGCNWNLCLLSG